MIHAAKLSKGQYLGSDDVKALQRLDEEERAYERALNLISYRQRSKAEVARRLEQKGVSEEAVEAVIERLCRAKLLDDEAFARYWISNREQFNPRGAYALRHELWQKGVAGSIIDALLQGLDETENAYRVATKRLARWERLEPAVRRRKLSDHLRRRGFSYETIQQVWERLTAEQPTDEFQGENREDMTRWDQE